MSEAGRDGDAIRYHVRRRRRGTVTIAVLLLALAGAFYYASSYYRATEPKPGPCTTEVAPAPLEPRDVTVNVYNSTSRSGLALSTSRLVADRGFKIKAVANDPRGKPVNGVAQIRHGPTGAESAKLLASHIPGAVLVQDKRKTDDVDLSIGTKWAKLGPVPRATTPTQTLPPCPTVTVDA